jgi:hypothetical protein
MMLLESFSNTWLFYNVNSKKYYQIVGFNTIFEQVLFSNRFMFRNLISQIMSEFISLIFKKYDI